MTLPRLAAMRSFWKENPPVRMMLQAKFGFFSKKEDTDQVIDDPEQALALLPSINQKIGGGLGRDG